MMCLLEPPLLLEMPQAAGPFQFTHFSSLRRHCDLHVFFVPSQRKRRRVWLLSEEKAEKSLASPQSPQALRRNLASFVSLFSSTINLPPSSTTRRGCHGEEGRGGSISEEKSLVAISFQISSLRHLHVASIWVCPTKGMMENVRA